MPSRKTNAANLYGGGAAPLQFTHTQTIAASTWTIDHNFGLPGAPAVTAWDAENNPVTPIGVTLVSRNQVIVAFGVTIAGSAVLTMPGAQSLDALRVGAASLTYENGRLSVDGVPVSLDGHTHSSLSVNFSAIAGLPTTLAGYGIVDALSSMRARASSPVQVSSTTLADVSSMSVQLAPNSTYRITLYVRFQSAANTTGIRLGLTTPTGSTISAQVSIPVKADSTSGVLQGSIIASGDSVLGTGVEAANTPYIATIFGVVSTGATGGSLQLRAASEINGSAVTVLPMSTMVADTI